MTPSRISESWERLYCSYYKKLFRQKFTRKAALSAFFWKLFKLLTGSKLLPGGRSFATA